MDDLTINRRLAEIAGVPLGRPSDEFGCEGNAMKMPHKQGLWSPLTDWSQLGPLMVKERITVVQSIQGSDSARAYYPDGKKGAEEPDTMRAIALAIIYKYEEE